MRISEMEASKSLRDLAWLIASPQDIRSAASGQRFKTFSDLSRTEGEPITDSNGDITDPYLVGYVEGGYG